MTTRGITPFLWTLFGAGGMVSALLFPVHIFLVGLAFPLGWVDAPDYAVLYGLAIHPISDYFSSLSLGPSLPLHGLRRVSTDERQEAGCFSVLRGGPGRHDNGGVHIIGNGMVRVGVIA